MVSYTRDHPVADTFAYLNALQPGIFSIGDIRRSVAAMKARGTADFEDLPPRT
jgi:hypothetical protein